MTAIERWTGAAALRDPLYNRGTAFGAEAREQLGLRGLLPPRVESITEQAQRVVEEVRRKPTPIEQYLHLASVHDENEALFFRVLVDDLHEMLPIVYTPTVGQACQEWSERFVRPRGVYLTANDAGRMLQILRSAVPRDIGIIVVTDGSRILGLGDLGINGMGIPIGKLALYTACAGVAPERCLPVTLDAGCDNAAVREHPHYLGLRMPRLSGAQYDAMVDEFVDAAQQAFPGVIVQFEDFKNAHAFRLLARYRERMCAFNDDVQGTGAMGVAGLMAAAHISGVAIGAQRILFAGAGEAALGMGAGVVSAMQRAGLAEADARRRCLFVDSKGTVVASRDDLAPHKRPFAQTIAPLPDLVATIEAFRPTTLIGASGQGGLFTRDVLKAMARVAERPVIFALSNPTSKAECTAEQAYTATDGRAIFASGSPFGPVTMNGQTFAPGQANNSYVFPGVGLGLLASGARRVTDAMFVAAADALAGMVSESDLAAGRVFPPQARMRDVAAAVATAVATTAYEQDLATKPRPVDLAASIRAAMYRPAYA
jgi:malate dehydrogenase (oxaloacetate-decarboxylating)(NADP+)